MTDDEIFNYAERRYYNDAEFHAKVEHTVGLIQRKVQPTKLTDRERILIRRAAMIGLAMEWVDPVTRALLDR